ncbi:MAG: prepilin-type N-terminal cleavage/methylation domain-containing protein [Candidatus Paceibacterota bacterium]
MIKISENTENTLKKTKLFSFCLKNKAFTLIELLVVIAIIGILSGLVAIAMSGAVDSANDAKRKQAVNAIAKALTIYGTFNGSYPVSVNPCNVGSTCLTTELTDNLGAVPLDPDGTYYQYFSNNGSNYTIFASLSNGDIYAKGPVQDCPQGYIDSGHGFCVMQYEAKAGAVSTPTGNPWVSIPQYSASVIDAIEACSSLGSGYHLITNAEWTVLASDAKQQPSNWNGSVMYRGHTDGSPNNALSVSNTSNPYDQTGQTSGEQRRTLNLQNGNVIWDFSGNVWEWTNNTCTIGTGTGNWYNSGAWIDWTDSNLSDYERKTAGVGSSLTSSNGVGRYYGCTANGNAFLRGGGWDSGSGAGAFALTLTYSPSYTYTALGFRCAR